MLLTMNQKVIIHTKIQQLLTNSSESSLCDYSDAYILVTGNITVTRTIAVPAGSSAGNQNPKENYHLLQLHKHYAPFEKFSTEIDGTLVDEVNFINITMPIYNLIEFSDNYSDTSVRLWNFN